MIGTPNVVLCYIVPSNYVHVIDLPDARAFLKIE